MVGLGLHEAQTMSFLGQSELDAMNLPDHDPRRAAIRVRNPLREEEAFLRTTLLPNLLKAVQYNVSHGMPDVGLFEVGKAFLAEPDSEDPRIPHQPTHLAFAMVGRSGPGGLHASLRPTDAYTATGVVRALLEALGHPAEIRQVASDGFHPGRSADVYMGEQLIGVAGELHPAVGRAFGLEGRVAAAELDLAGLVADRDWWQLEAPSTYPRVEFDLAFIVDESTSAESVVRSASSSAGDWLEEIFVFDEFRGGSLDEGKKMPNLFRAVLTTFDIMQNSIIKEKVHRHAPHIYIKPDIRGVDILDFYKADEVYAQAAPAQQTLREQLTQILSL